MLKQFNINKLVFDEPIINTDKDGHKTYSTSGDDWYPVDTQEQVDRIWQSVSEGGTVWTEDGELKCSGPTPSPAHKWQGGKWVICAKTQMEQVVQAKHSFIAAIDNRAADIYQHWMRYAEEYKEREAAALAYKAADYQGEVSPYISGFAVPVGIDNKTATDLILAQAQGLHRLQEQLAAQRMRKYELKRADLSLEQMQAIYQDIINQMDALAEAHQ